MLDMAQLALSVTLTTGVALHATWYVWSHILSLLFLPSQVVYMMRQQVLDPAREEFLREHAHAERVTIPVRAPPQGAKYVIDRLLRLLKLRSGGMTATEPLAAELDAVLVKNPSFGTAGADNVLVQFNANGVAYEETFDATKQVQKAFHDKGWPCNVLLVNYRGVGNSGGRIARGDDLKYDALAVVRWLVEERRVAPSRILIHGHSMGGAAGVLACAQLTADGKGAPFMLADRTFNHLITVVEEKLGTAFDMTPIGAAIFANAAAIVCFLIRIGFGVELPRFLPLTITLVGLAAVFIAMLIEKNLGVAFPLDKFTSVASIAPRSQRIIIALVRVLKLALSASALWGACTLFGPVTEVILVAAAIGAWCGRQGWLRGVALTLVAALGWHMDIGEAWKRLDPSRTLVIWHGEDEMIVNKASLARTCEDAGAAASVFTLKGTMTSAHMLHAFSFPHDRAAILERLNRFMSSSTGR